jgi:hypothetical protein
MEESDFDKLVVYTLRVELADGKILRYRIDAENKNDLIERFRERSDGDSEISRLQFLWFETSHKRRVMINTDSVVRTTFCFDAAAVVKKPESYYDNFGVVTKETSLEDLETKDGDIRLHVVHEEYIPSAIIYHKGKAPEGDHYYTNPMKYDDLQDGELDGLDLELEGEYPLRQFIGLMDEDGEHSFISISQVVVLEVAQNVVVSQEELE